MPSSFILRVSVLRPQPRSLRRPASSRRLAQRDADQMRSTSAPHDRAAAPCLRPIPARPMRKLCHPIVARELARLRAAEIGWNILGADLASGAVTVSRRHALTSWRTLPASRTSPAPSPRRSPAISFHPELLPGDRQIMPQQFRNVSRRSRSGGISMRMTLSRCSRSSRSARTLPAPPKSWWVAAMTRTSTFTGVWRRRDRIASAKRAAISLQPAANVAICRGTRSAVRC